MLKIHRLRMMLQAVGIPLIFMLPPTSFAMGMMDGQIGDMMGGSSARHVYIMRDGLDSNYANMTNPLPPSVENIKAGKFLYKQNCTTCHGATGRGDGEAGKSLNPPPADLATLVRMPVASDGYLYWAVAKGGTAFKSAMPAMKDSMKESDIWKVILYLRSF
jgi:mono/diheme cytochrome c family protein